MDIARGERVATLAWNSHRHLALYYGVSASGRVLHTINPRLFPDQIAYIVNHAEDRVLCFDLAFAPLVHQLAPRLETVRHFVALCDRTHVPAVDLPDLLCFDEWLSAHDERHCWPALDERTASSLCYTSGTTGNPKGVLYSHRSTLLHSLMTLAPDTLGLSAGETLLLNVPMFHANAWGVPYAAPMAGTKMVLPGPSLDGQSVFELMRDEKVTLSLGVPTVWMMFFLYLDAHPELDLHALALRRVQIGGSAVPRAMLERFESLGVEVIQGWGLTETGPIGVIGKLLPKHAGLHGEDLVNVKLKQGRGIWGVELKIVDDDERPVPWDGSTFGHVRVRGPWVASGYFKGEGGSPLDAQGFFKTGDIATIDADGYLQMVDRAKDLIKSGGEWISSIEVENAVMSHPAVAEAAVIGVAHPKWQERPLLLVVPRPGQAVDAQALTDHLAARVAKWWLPDDVIVVSELPHTATGKLLKTRLREQYRDHFIARNAESAITS